VAERCQRILEAFYLGVMLMFVGNLIIFISLFFANPTTHVEESPAHVAPTRKMFWMLGPRQTNTGKEQTGISSTLPPLIQKKRKKYITQKENIEKYTYVPHIHIRLWPKVKNKEFCPDVNAPLTRSAGCHKDSVTGWVTFFHFFVSLHLLLPLLLTNKERISRISCNKSS